MICTKKNEIGSINTYILQKYDQVRKTILKFEVRLDENCQIKS